MRTVAACVLVLILSACGSAGDVAASSAASPSHPPQSGDSTAQPSAQPSALPSAQPSAGPSPSVTPSPDGAPPAKGLPKIVGAVRAFSSPSRNIGCAIGSSSVRCDIDEHSFEPPPEPSGCSHSWGTSVQVASGPAAFVCVSDSTLDAKRVLKYGTSTVVGGFGCTSRRSGVTCLNLKTDHGFKIARAGVEVF